MQSQGISRDLDGGEVVVSFEQNLDVLFRVLWRRVWGNYALLDKLCPFKFQEFLISFICGMYHSCGAVQCGALVFILCFFGCQGQEEVCVNSFVGAERMDQIGA